MVTACFDTATILLDPSEDDKAPSDNGQLVHYDGLSCFFVSLGVVLRILIAFNAFVLHLENKSTARPEDKPLSLNIRFSSRPLLTLLTDPFPPQPKHSQPARQSPSHPSWPDRTRSGECS